MTYWQTNSCRKTQKGEKIKSSPQTRLRTSNARKRPRLRPSYITWTTSVLFALHVSYWPVMHKLKRVWVTRFMSEGKTGISFSLMKAHCAIWLHYTDTQRAHKLCKHRALLAPMQPPCWCLLDAEEAKSLKYRLEKGAGDVNFSHKKCRSKWKSSLRLQRKACIFCNEPVIKCWKPTL